MTDLAIYESPTRQALDLVGPATKLVTQIADTTFVPPAYRGKPGELLAAILTGDEIGLGPMTAIAQIHNIEGRASLSAQAMRALVLSKGHDIWVEENTTTKCVLGGQRRGSEKPSYITWTIEDAKRANLTGKKNWRGYPKAMLLARASGDLCRAIFADVLGGIAYNVEELEDGILDQIEDEPEAVGARPEGAAPPPAKKTTRKATGKAAPKKAAAKASPIPAPAEPAGPVDPMAEFDDIEAQAKPGAFAPIDDDTIVDAEEVEPDEVPADVEGAALPPDRALARRAQEVGLDDDHRHGLYVALTSGRASSGKDLTVDEVREAFDLLDQIEAGAAEVKPGEPGEWFVEVGGEEAYYGAQVPTGDAAPPADDGDAPGFDADGWRALCEEHGRKPGGMMIQARKIAKAIGVDPPNAIEEIPGADGALRVQLAAWIREGSK